MSDILHPIVNYCPMATAIAREARGKRCRLDGGLVFDYRPQATKLTRPEDYEMSPEEWEWRSEAGLSSTMKGLVAILAVLVGVILLADVRHIDTLPETQRVEVIATEGQTDATLRGEPTPLFE